VKALQNLNLAIGESFHAVSPAALTLRGYAESVAGWFGREANLDFLPFDEWTTTVSEGDANATEGHLEHSPNCYSIEKARRLLDYQPRYTSLQATYESLQWLIANDVISLN
jgi:nucleoside-diphosphate-sugar epimerase